MDKEQLRKDLESKITQLPSLPSVVTELVKVINHPRSNAAQAEKLLENDIGLSSHVLKLANSSYYGIPHTISSIRNAVVLLGFETIKTLILSSSMVRMFPTSKNQSAFDKSLFWKHSLQVGIISRKLTDDLGLEIDRDMMFTAGLLHDIGKLVLEQLYPTEYQEVINQIDSGSTSWEFAEEGELGFSHTWVANILLELWGVPQSVREPIVFHLKPLKTPGDQRTAHILHYANYLSMKMGTRCIAGEREPFLAPNIKEYLGLPEEDEAMIEIMRQEFSKASEFFQLISSSK